MSSHTDDDFAVAVLCNEIDTARSLLLCDANAIEIDKLNKSKALCLAAVNGRTEILSLLLDAGADIDAVDENNKTACYIAIQFGQFDALRLLIDRGANVSVVSVNGPRRTSLLNAAAWHGDARITQLLLDAGAPLDNLTDENLIDLVRSVAVLHRLLARNVNVSALRGFKKTTLCHGVILNANRGDDIADLLRAVVNVGGLNVNACDMDGATPLHRAAARLNLVAIRTLVELGADVDQQQIDGRTALHRLCGGKAEGSACAELLLALGANVRLGTEEGMSPCHHAAFFHDAALMCSLIAGGGDLDQQDYENVTPRSVALRNSVPLPAVEEIDNARRRIAKARLDLVRHRAYQICIGLQPLNLDALQLCEILTHSCQPNGSLILFHQWWRIATTVKHFKRY